MRNLRVMLMVLGAFWLITFKVQAIEFSTLTIEQSLEKAQIENKFVLVYFYSTNCSHCVYMEKSVFPDAQLTQLVNDSFIAVKSNAGNPTGRMEYYEYSIKAHPTILILNSVGVEVKRLVGRKEIEALKNELTQIKENKEQLMKALPMKEEKPLQEPEPDPSNPSIRQNTIRQKF